MKFSVGNFCLETVRRFVTGCFGRLGNWLENGYGSYELLEIRKLVRKLCLENG